DLAGEDVLLDRVVGSLGLRGRCRAHDAEASAVVRGGHRTAVEVSVERTAESSCSASFGSGSRGRRGAPAEWPSSFKPALTVTDNPYRTSRLASGANARSCRWAAARSWSTATARYSATQRSGTRFAMPVVQPWAPMTSAGNAYGSNPPPRMLTRSPSAARNWGIRLTSMVASLTATRVSRSLSRSSRSGVKSTLEVKGLL